MMGYQYFFFLSEDAHFGVYNILLTRDLPLFNKEAATTLSDESPLMTAAMWKSEIDDVFQEAKPSPSHFWLPSLTPSYDGAKV